ncbi:hypothetical protein SUGI_0393110 [Cryptomeria japonica]|nr:hypothetical protein SUGI_0393110 [Cryptomeria japonica]
MHRFLFRSHAMSVLLLLLLLQGATCRRLKASSLAVSPPKQAFNSVNVEMRRKRHKRGEFRDCLPKGFRPPPSAPSHFGNSQTFSISWDADVAFTLVIYVKIQLDVLFSVFEIQMVQVMRENRDKNKTCSTL